MRRHRANYTGGTAPSATRRLRRHDQGDRPPGGSGRADRAVAKIPTAPAHVRGPAPLPGQHSGKLGATRPRPSVAASPSRTGLACGPLAGITIVEAAYYYATPFATALLADLGARVIKIEPVKGDPYRALAGGAVGSDPVLNLGHNNMVRAMQGKDSIALNLKDPRGRHIVRQLVGKADVFVHSFRPGVPESLGIDEDTLRAIKPDIVYQYGASYGSTGPYSRQPAIDPVIAALPAPPLTKRDKAIRRSPRQVPIRSRPPDTRRP